MKSNSEDSIKVFVRVRPLNSKEQESGSILAALDAKNIQISDREKDKDKDSEHKFAFDHIFPMDATQGEVYDKIGKEVVASAFEGFNGTIFAYGQTASGKTHTCIGPDYNDTQLKGVLPRLINNIFENIMEAPPYIEFRIKVSMVQIYMQKIQDLLDPTKTDIKIREGKGKGIYMQDVTEEYLSSASDAMKLLNKGIENRSVGQTNMNDVSSRSHMAFIITLHQNNLNDASAKSGKIILIDLAGSEKIGKTGAQGKLLDEAKQINKSLSALGNVINALTDAKVAHIPYRDSKLTRLLQESLGGNSKTNLIINISPSCLNFPQSLSSLRFGSRAKQIKNKPKINKQYTVAELLLLLEKAEKRIQELQQINRQSSNRKKVSSRLSTTPAFVENLLDSENPMSDMDSDLDPDMFKKKRRSLMKEEAFESEYMSSDNELENEQMHKSPTNEEKESEATVEEEKELLIEEIHEIQEEKTAITRELDLTKQKNQFMLREAKVTQSKLATQQKQGEKLLEKFIQESLENQQKAEIIEELQSTIEEYENSILNLSAVHKNSVSQVFGVSSNQLIKETEKLISKVLDKHQENEQTQQIGKKVQQKQQDLGQVKQLQTDKKKLKEELNIYKHLEESKQRFIQQRIRFGKEKEMLYHDLENRIAKVLDLEERLDEELERRKVYEEVIKADDTTKAKKIITLQQQLTEINQKFYVLKGQQSSWVTNNHRVQQQAKIKNERIINLQMDIMSLKEEIQNLKLRNEQLEETVEEAMNMPMDGTMNMPMNMSYPLHSRGEGPSQPNIVRVLRSSTLKLGFS